MLESYKKYMCSTCKAKCDKGIVIVNYNGTKQARCTDYKKDESKIEKYKRQEQRTAKQLKSIMGFKQNY